MEYIKSKFLADMILAKLPIATRIAENSEGETIKLYAALNYTEWFVVLIPNDVDIKAGSIPSISCHRNQESANYDFESLMWNLNAKEDNFIN